ncbi:MAG: response regulator [Deltaproteobacteria bacterium]|nr:response regulator [Deltaproteobacteria bacterium]
MGGDSGQNQPPIPVQIRPGIPIIICTGFSDKNDEQYAKAMGVKGFLMKPVLAVKVRKVLNDAKIARLKYCYPDC